MPDWSGRLAVQVYQVAPRVVPGLEIRTKALQIVAGRAQMVVNHVEHDGQASAVTGINEPFETIGSAIRLVHGIPKHAVIAPVPFAVEIVDWQYLHVGHTQLD